MSFTPVPTALKSRFWRLSGFFTTFLLNEAFCGQSDSIPEPFGKSFLFSRKCRLIHLVPALFILFGRQMLLFMLQQIPDFLFNLMICPIPFTFFHLVIVYLFDQIFHNSTADFPAPRPPSIVFKTKYDAETIPIIRLQSTNSIIFLHRTFSYFDFI